jgi:hypothetical protein
MEAECYLEMQVSFYLTVWRYVAEVRLFAKVIFCTEVEEQQAERLPLMRSYLNVCAPVKTSFQASNSATRKYYYGLRCFLTCTASAELLSKFHLGSL